MSEKIRTPSADLEAHAQRLVKEQCAQLRPEIEQRFAQMWEAPELSAMEFQSSALLADWLVTHGFDVKRNSGGVPTAFLASRVLGTGPRIAILAEYDALPNLANDVVPHRSPRVQPAGQACGHNHIGPANCGAAIIAAYAAAELGLAGEILVVGCPAEEILWGKLALLKQGVFAGFDAILTSHGDYQNGAISRPCQSVLSGEFVFYGEAGHGGRPGRWNALEVAEAVVQRAGQLHRERFADATVRHVLRNSGVMPSITPDEARVWFTTRHVSFARAKAFYDAIVELVAETAAESGVSVRHQPIAGTRGYLANDVLARLLLDCLTIAGLPEWTADERRWMEELCEAARPGEAMTLHDTIDLYDEGEDYYGQDDGEVSWRIPLGRVNWAYPEQVPIHHWAWTAWSGHPSSGRGALMATNALALAAVHLLANPAIVQDAQSELAQRTAGETLSDPIVGAWRTLTEAPETFWDATWVE